MINLIAKIPAYQMFRSCGFPRLYPLNLTVSVTYRCNSRCKTCNIYTKDSSEFTTDEFEKTFRSIGLSPFWMTMSGGEPFLRKDIVEICRSAYEYCKPKIINIPTNGILTQAITKGVEQIVQNSPDSQIIVNLSIDEIGKKHDEIRNVKNNFKKTIETFKNLKKLNYPNLTVGIHTVISKYNVNNFRNIYESLLQLNPDSYITEIAEERVELGTIGEGITPSLQEYSLAIDFLSKKIKEQHHKGFSAITQAFRLHYYQLVKKTLQEKRQVLPCYAGVMSAHIAPDGELWACCIKAESMGNLKQVHYNFEKLWFSEKAEALRHTIKAQHCFCPLANASYTNMLCSYPIVGAVLKNITANTLKNYFHKS